MWEVLAGGLLADDPRMGQDLVSGETLGGVDGKDLADEVLGHVGDLVPVRGGEVELPLLDDLEQFLVVLGVKGREATES